ncbi:nuclear transport factor 2 family protein [Actinomadura rayongensis]|uniref:SnoaL-like domain-containing protein n=1 Tax=Actinomadura rayongensis TaxID=1429076 RepID=A0A6I4W5L7_9ACTN|nr:nuclear transport factor 2 family protein [Actinomadura rayongensis]MXQ63516.1 hypothetical protein [Actinomadura rayongensis]
MSKKIVELFIEASEKSDLETALGLFADGGVWIDPAGKVYQGDAIEPYLVQQIDLLHQFNAQGVTVNYSEAVEAVAGDEDWVYLAATVNQADGTEIRRFVDVFKLRDGKIVVKDVFSKE